MGSEVGRDVHRLVLVENGCGCHAEPRKQQERKKKEGEIEAVAQWQIGLESLGPVSGNAKRC